MWKYLLTTSLVLALAAAACGGDGDDGTTGTTPGGSTRLVIATPELFLSRDPLVGGTTTSSEINFQVYEMPVAFKFASQEVKGGKALVQQGDEWEPWLAESVNVSADGLVYTFKLRRGVKFYPSGNEMTAEDWHYMFERGLNSPKGFGRYMASQVGYTQVGRIIDPYTYELTLSRPTPTFHYAALINTAIIDSKEAKKNATPEDPWSTAWLDKNTAGTGPYYLKSTSDSEIVLAANPNYWGKKPFFQEIVYRYIPNVSDRVLLLRSGEVDVAYRLPQKELNDLAKVSGLKVLSAPSNTIDVMFMNVNKAPTSDQNVRKAIIAAIPYDDIISNVFFGLARKYNGLFMDEALGFVAGPTPTQDLTRARQLLQQSQYPNGFTVDMLVRADSAQNEQEALLIKDALSKIGITVNIVKLASGDYSATAKNYPLVLRTNHPWLDEGLHVAVSYVLPTASFNYSDLQLPAIAEEFAKAYSASREVRKAAYERIQQLWYAADPMAFLARFDQGWAMKSNIQDFVVAEVQQPIWARSSRSK
jgi:peptide/nickel transport system substrate-binding protein